MHGGCPPYPSSGGADRVATNLSRSYHIWSGSAAWRHCTAFLGCPCMVPRKLVCTFQTKGSVPSERVSLSTGSCCLPSHPLAVEGVFCRVTHECRLPESR